MIIVGLLWIALTFSLRLAYLARSKGYNPWQYGIVTVVACALCAYVLGLLFPVPRLSTPELPGWAVGVILGGLGIRWFLKNRTAQEGALGDAYLNVSFACPECHKEISFHRSRRGLTEDCPHCGELVSIPTGAEGQTGSRPLKPRGSAQDWVCARSYTLDYLADLHYNILSDAGIKASVSRDDAAGTLNFLQGGGGIRLMIQLADWDKVQELLEEADSAA